ncbi:MAG TPA: tripartite tricarboxylate transporter permease [Alphaproteobacteria bacterium]|nr:tripartite tricarboxylate transporter permease [Alphaproteobacteria bacterium]
MLQFLYDAVFSALEPVRFAFLITGTLLGIVVGGIPGLTALMLISLSLPLTFYMADVNALALLVGMYVGGISGGAVTAVVLGIPGTPSSILTIFDGHTLARSGKVERALAWAVFSSFIGSIVSWVFLATLSVPLARFALRFSPFDLFGLCLLALTTIVAISRGDFLFGLISGLFGILLSMVGTDPIGGDYRLTFGILDLATGFDVLPVLLGLFAGASVLSWAFNKGDPGSPEAARFSALNLPVSEIMSRWWSFLRSSVIGVAVGILPGIGGNIGSIIAYSAARAQSKEPETFGKGNIDGIIASEAGNNATVGGALIPLIALGIPGSVIDVVLLGALTIHNIQPGPYLFRNNPEIVYVMISSMLLASFVMLIALWYGSWLIMYVSRIQRSILFPFITVFSVLGSFALANRWFDVGVMAVFSLLGLIMSIGRVPVGPFIIGLVLGPTVEKYYRVGLMQSGGSHLPMITSPVAALSMIAIVMLLCWPLINRYKRRTNSLNARARG